MNNIKTRLIELPVTPAEQLMSEIDNLYMSKLRIFANSNLLPEFVATTVSEITNIRNECNALYSPENINLEGLQMVIVKLRTYKPPHYIKLKISSEL